MLKLLICLFSALAISVALLQLRQQRLELNYQANRLHNQIEEHQAKLWDQQLQIAVYTAPNAISRTVGEQKLDLRLDGNIETDIVSETATAYGLAGRMEAHLAVGGTIPDPQFSGRAEMKGGRLVTTQQLSLVGDRIDLSLAFDGRTIQIERASGLVDIDELLAVTKAPVAVTPPPPPAPLPLETRRTGRVPRP